MSADNKFVRSLIQNAKQGNNAAIEQLFQMNLGKIYAFALRLTANKTIAESITKETFIEAWRKINLVRPDASFLKWLNAITVYKTIDALRSQKQDSQKIKSDIKEIHAKDDLDNYILNLPEQERMIFVLSQLEGYSVDEISDLMGIKKDQVNIHLDIANSKIIDNDPTLKTPEMMKGRLSKLPPEIEPPVSVRDGIFSFIMEEKLKEQKEIEKIAAQVEKDEKESDKNELKETKEEITKEEIVLPKKKKKLNIQLIKKWLYAVAAIVVVYFAYKIIFSQSGWEIMQFSGQPQINNKKIQEGDTFSPSATITTDDNSSVTISIPDIGRLLIDSSSIVSRAEKGFEINVEKGQIKKYEGNATDFLIVQTPLAKVKELYKGSAFRLKVIDRDVTKINVESGWLTVEVKEFESYIPKNYSCVISRGRYVLPYSSNARPELINLMEGFSGVNDPSIGTILTLVTRKDAISLWHLLQLVSSENRFIVFDRLNEFIPIPNGVTKEGIQALNKDMLMKWRQEIELKMD
ncbi:MAG TPA: sigma-70 family RNA polymerase sigma factor [Ignavibacteriaceae bacterium]|nr:sigma-70 family RNA polymerase sigma factor [Ignavibacteriaceae bacterium]